MLLTGWGRWQACFQSALKDDNDPFVLMYKLFGGCQSCRSCFDPSHIWWETTAQTVLNAPTHKCVQVSDALMNQRLKVSPQIKQSGMFWESKVDLLGDVTPRHRLLHWAQAELLPFFICAPVVTSRHWGFPPRLIFVTESAQRSHAFISSEIYLPFMAHKDH